MAPRELLRLSARIVLVNNKAEATYRRGDLFQKRRALIDDWSRFLAGAGAKVVRLRRADR